MVDHDQSDCDEILRELYDFLDDELTPANRVRIRHHLEACHHCLEAFDFEAELRQVIAMKCRERTPPGLLERIRNALGQEASRFPA